MKKKIVLVIMVAVIAMTSMVMLAGCNESATVEISSVSKSIITDSKGVVCKDTDTLKLSETYYYTASLAITLNALVDLTSITLLADITISNCEVTGTYSMLSQGEVANGEINIDGETSDKSDIRLTLSEVGKVFTCEIKLIIKPKKAGELSATMKFDQNVAYLHLNDVAKNPLNLVAKITEKEKLKAPILTFDSNNLSFSWVKVDNAVGYIVCKNGKAVTDTILGPTATTYLLQVSSNEADIWYVEAIGDDSYVNALSNSITGIIA